jgi:SSS family transporter
MSSGLILFFILAYFLVLISISYITGKRADNAAFFIGNRKSPWFVVAFGMIGATLSGVTFISVPGWVSDSQFSYIQMVLGYLAGYYFIANVLMPLYYRLNLTSIYTYLEQRFGNAAYKTGASFFLISRVIGASFRLFLVANVLQIAVFRAWGVPFMVTVVVTIVLIWFYTFKGGIRTIIWTDTIQTAFMLIAVILAIILIIRELDGNFIEIIQQVKQSNISQIFFWDWKIEQNFFKQFLGGAFITIVMTGLDQDMMQKNLSCRNIHEAKKNMYWFSASLIPVNLIFLFLGALLIIYSQHIGLSIPERSDDIFPLIALKGSLSPILGVFFVLGLVAAAYSSADSALTALTTSFTIDILNTKHLPEKKVKKIRIRVHLFISTLLGLVILVFKALNDESVISALFKVAGYTYGPLLGLFSFGLFTKFNIKASSIPIIAILSPCLSYLISLYSEQLLFGYKFGFELLVVNGLISFLGFYLFRERNSKS